MPTGSRAWSFQPLRKHNPPAVQNAKWAQRPIDSFLLAAMEQRKLSEDQAYGALRKMAMDQNLALAEVARRVIAVSQLLA